MDTEALVPWLTFAGLIVTGLVAPWALRRMDKQDKRATSEAQLWRRYMNLRERYNAFADRCLRRVQRGLHLMEQGKHDEAYKVLLEHAKDLEGAELEPLRDE